MSVMEKESDMPTATYTVTGMTCGHCVNSVKTEIGKIGGVTSVDIDLASGAVRVDSTAPIADADISAAVDEAGYDVAV